MGCSSPWDVSGGRQSGMHSCSIGQPPAAGSWAGVSSKASEVQEAASALQLCAGRLMMSTA
jgi:hypothetical protein